jgi:hypothetical protein
VHFGEHSSRLEILLHSLHIYSGSQRKKWIIFVLQFEEEEELLPSHWVRRYELRRKKLAMLLGN